MTDFLLLRLFVERRVVCVGIMCRFALFYDAMNLPLMLIEGILYAEFRGGFCSFVQRNMVLLPYAPVRGAFLCGRHLLHVPLVRGINCCKKSARRGPPSAELKGGDERRYNQRDLSASTAASSVATSSMEITVTSLEIRAIMPASVLPGPISIKSVWP